MPAFAGRPAAPSAGGRLFGRIRAAARGDPSRAAVVGAAGSLSYRDLLARAERLAGRLDPRGGPVLLYGHKEPGMLVGLLASLRLGRPYAPVDASVPAGRLEDLLQVVRPGSAVAVQPLPPAVERRLADSGVDVEPLGPLGEEAAGDPLRWAPLEAAADDPAGRRDGSAGRAGDPAVWRGDPDGRRDGSAGSAGDPAGWRDGATGCSDGSTGGSGRPPGRMAYILTTSGTTGEPKGVPVPEDGLEHLLDWVQAEQRFRPGETFLNQAPLNFDLSVLDVYGSLLTGGTLWCVDRAEIADPRRLFARLEGAPLTVWVSTPSFAAFCLAEPRFGAGMLPALRKFLFCGETLPPATLRRLGRRFPQAEVWNLYGPTETTVAVTSVRLDAAAARDDSPLPVGRPAPGMSVWVADPVDPLSALPPGAEGEIVVAGPQVAPGYRTAAGRPVPPGFLDLPGGGCAYRTGDRGRFGPDGLLYCGGRLDRQVKIHGYRVEPEEVEARLRGVPGVGDAAVLVAARGGAPDHLVAFVVASPGGPLPAGDLALSRHLRDALSDRLPAYALPRRAVRLAEPPLTANGKLDRGALQGMLP